ncbi:hypothetical protein K402DRAFT_424101 [Aulographum hederae CBS 113979]|uniref:Integral membrane protein n=1 Tax=Aulographum hederae CBS 113979 TaxID=1176131 RepID=A0A6G1GQ65_9PEZI|nr:hypothetical protein K402DRAFT_424101 [Aulographum hederae CBS 113979]
MSFIPRLTSNIPLDYIPPQFPSLYWPFPISGTQAVYLYNPSDIWRFTLLWTLICFAAVHLAASGYAVVVQWKNWKIIWVVPVIYAVVGGAEAFIAGSVIGGLTGAIYNAGYFRMSTWIPLAWGVTNTLVLILSSFAIQGGL